MKEDVAAVPTNNAGQGNIAALGVGPQGEPGKKKKGVMPFLAFVHRKTPVSK